MLNSFHRAFAMCKSGDLPTGVFSSARDPFKWPLHRLGLWLCISLTALVLGFVADDYVARVVTVGSSTFLKNLAGFSSKSGEGWVVGVTGLACSLILFWRGRFDASRGAFLVAFTGLLTGAAATIIRSLMGRTRPSSHALQGFYGIWHDSHWIIGKYEFGAFPSGHAATVIGVAAAAWLINRRLGIVTTGYALLVSWSRIAMGCHHFSDEVASAILGIYGAHLVLARLGPSVSWVWQNLQSAWLARKTPARPAITQEQV